ncbi:hypothetical protein K438DRAFT_1956356 [Mycena galopus ATCC 62051]|nr:hypothetical protein K438DRAFT_1956356 [Mycena galopus ATCC 62051]
MHPPQDQPFPPISPHIGNKTAPELFGMLFNYGLMGSLVVQVYNYYQAFPKDPTFTKSTVYTVLVLEGMGICMCFYKSALEWFPVCILGSVIAGIVQLFYAHRLRLYSGSWITGGIVAVLAVLQIGSGIGQGLISEQLVDRSKLTGRPICLTIWLVSTALCDVLIAGFMTYYLKREPIKCNRLRNTVTRIVRYTVETGAITAIVATMQLVVAHAFPKKDYFETPSWMLGKLYSNNLLVLLNARALTLGGRDYIHSTQEYPSLDALRWLRIMPALVVSRFQLLFLKL